jgi:hypothetical protein
VAFAVQNNIIEIAFIEKPETEAGMSMHSRRQRPRQGNELARLSRARNSF